MNFYHFNSHNPNEEVIITISGEFKFFERRYIINFCEYVVMREVKDVVDYRILNGSVSSRYEIDGRIEPHYIRSLFVLGED